MPYQGSTQHGARASNALTECHLSCRTLVVFHSKRKAGDRGGRLLPSSGVRSGATPERRCRCPPRSNASPAAPLAHSPAPTPASNGASQCWMRGASQHRSRGASDTKTSASAMLNRLHSKVQRTNLADLVALMQQVARTGSRPRLSCITCSARTASPKPMAAYAPPSARPSSSPGPAVGVLPPLHARDSRTV